MSTVSAEPFSADTMTYACYSSTSVLVPHQWCDFDFLVAGLNLRAPGLVSVRCFRLMDILAGVYIMLWWFNVRNPVSLSVYRAWTTAYSTVVQYSTEQNSAVENLQHRCSECSLDCRTSGVRRDLSIVLRVLTGIEVR